MIGDLLDHAERGIVTAYIHRRQAVTGKYKPPHFAGEVIGTCRAVLCGNTGDFQFTTIRARHNVVAPKR